ncbi:MAG: hypothetical protein GTO41_00135, partial [Burkholderiales bacterium]|nr:hypothetical protein [Burkholderiales bacterium]
APDYVINAGGIIQIAIDDEALLREKLLNIYDTLMRVFDQSAKTNQPSHRVADSIVEAILYGPEEPKRAGGLAQS